MDPHRTVDNQPAMVRRIALMRYGLLGSDMLMHQYRVEPACGLIIAPEDRSYRGYSLIEIQRHRPLHRRCHRCAALHSAISRGR